MNRFLYLVQGAKTNVLNFKNLQTLYSDLVVLTYDSLIEDEELNCYKILFHPNSTWAEGRNLQVEYAKSLNQKYEYYIFLDDDVDFIKGDFNVFEKLLVKYNPGIGLPLCDIVKNSNYYLSFLDIQRPIAIDQLIQAYRRDIFFRSQLLPFETKFDSRSWWYSCEINSYLILRYYLNQTIQFNNVEVLNKNHDWSHSSRNTHSVYKSGTTHEGLEIVKIYLEKRFGKQQNYLNTLFRSNIFPRYIFVFNIFDALRHFSILLLDFANYKKAIIFAIKYFLHLPFRLLNLLVFKNQKLPVIIE